MDRDTLDAMVRPWWLTPPAFLVVMILALVVCLGYLGLEWYFDHQMQALFKLLS